MRAFADWLLELVKKAFDAAWDFITDIFVSILAAFLDAISTLLGALPVPSFMSGGLSTVLGQISPDVWFFASHFKFSQCFAVLGAAVVFRLTRKVLTLFQW